MEDYQKIIVKLLRNLHKISKARLFGVSEIPTPITRALRVTTLLSSSIWKIVYTNKTSYQLIRIFTKENIKKQLKGINKEHMQ